MSGPGTRTRSGEKARAKAAGKATKSTPTRTKGPVRAGTAAAPPRRHRSAPAPEAAAPPRRRRRVVAWVVAVVVVVGGLAAGVALSPLLDVESVEVTGVVAERADAVREAAGVAVGDPALAVLPGRVAGRVEALPWVADARVTREIPGAVRIAVVPRTPVGWVTAGERVLLVDADGTVIEKVDVPPAGVPALLGVADLAPVGGRIAPGSLAASAGALGAELRLRVVAVALEDGAVAVQVANGPQLRFGTPERMVLKARVAAAVLASLADTPVTYVDVSVPAAPVSG